jgi:hypothetical protein
MSSGRLDFSGTKIACVYPTTMPKRADLLAEMNDIFHQFHNLVENSFTPHAPDARAVARAKTLIARHAALLEEVGRLESKAEQRLRARFPLQALSRS